MLLNNIWLVIFLPEETIDWVFDNSVGLPTAASMSVRYAYIHFVMVALCNRADHYIFAL